MKSAELLRKCGYRKKYTDNGCIIYELIEKKEYSDLPEEFLIRKCSYEVEFSSDYIDKHTHLGTFYFNIGAELWQAINEKIEELKLEKTKNKK